MPAPYRRGSGRSFSTAIVSGVVADMLSGNHKLSPNRIKFALMSTARPYPGVGAMVQGAGVPNGYQALTAAPAGMANQGQVWSNGTGSLDLSRGSVSVDLFGVDGSVTHVGGNTTAALNTYNALNYFGTVWTSSTWWTSQ